MGDPKIEILDEAFCVAMWRNVFIQLWIDAPIEERTRAMRAAARKFMAQTPGPVGAVVVVAPRCPVPDPAAREHSVGFLSDMRDRAKGVVLVFEGEGFLAAASRLAMVGMIASARYPFDYKVARQVSEAESFLLPLLPHPWPSGELVQVVDRLRLRIPYQNAATR